MVLWVVKVKQSWKPEELVVTLHAITISLSDLVRLNTMCKKIYKQHFLGSWAAFKLDSRDKVLMAHTSPTVEISSMPQPAEAPVKKEHNTEAQVHHHLKQNCTSKTS
jgi:hypothetical protein